MFEYLELFGEGWEVWPCLRTYLKFNKPMQFPVSSFTALCLWIET